MTEPENPLRRWARLKQAAKDGRPDAGAGGEPAAPDAVPDAPFDPASLPPIESILAGTDITAFLRASVPAELTRAALRRAWASDPAIRDFIGIAENQWDFNDPNAIPGFGPLDPSENPADILAQVSRRLAQFQEAASEAPDRSADIGPRETHVDQSSEPKEPPPAVAATPPADMQVAGVEDAREPAVDAHDAFHKRRHGSALPR